MAQPATRAEFTDYCLRKLGAPVLEINVDDNQVDDLIDDAIQLYQEYHFDGVEKMFLKHCITDDDVTRFTSSDQNTIGSDDTPAPVAENTWIERDNFLQIPDHVIGISKVFGVSSGLSDNEMWGFANQYFLMDVFSFSSGYTFGNFDMSYFYMIKQWFETLDMVVNTGNLVQYRFNRKQDRLYIDIDPDRIKANQYLLIECYRALNPTDWSQIWNDSWLKKYAPALIKRQWGQNMIKFNNVQLPGGITMNGRQLWEDGNSEVRMLEERLMKDYQLPPLDMIG